MVTLKEDSMEESSKESENVKVVVRVRPLNDSEMHYATNQESVLLIGLLSMHLKLKAD